MAGRVSAIEVAVSGFQLHLMLCFRGCELEEHTEEQKDTQ